MTLLSPWWLLLILPVALLAGVYVVQQRRRSQYAVRFASLPMLERLVPRRPGWRRHAPVVALLFAFALLALAAARPEIDIRVPRERATVLVAIDVSLSMKATDVEPNRLDAAADAATKFVDLAPGSPVRSACSATGPATGWGWPTSAATACAWSSPLPPRRLLCGRCRPRPSSRLRRDGLPPAARGRCRSR